MSSDGVGSRDDEDGGNDRTTEESDGAFEGILMGAMGGVKSEDVDDGREDDGTEENDGEVGPKIRGGFCAKAEKDASTKSATEDGCIDEKMESHVEPVSSEDAVGVHLWMELKKGFRLIVLISL